MTLFPFHFRGNQENPKTIVESKLDSRYENQNPQTRIRKSREKSRIQKCESENPISIVRIRKIQFGFWFDWRSRIQKNHSIQKFRALIFSFIQKATLGSKSLKMRGCCWIGSTSTFTGGKSYSDQPKSYSISLLKSAIT